MFLDFKRKTTKKPDKENANDISSIKREFSAVKMGIETRNKTRKELDEIVKHMETDFESKYRLFKNVNNVGRLSHTRVRDASISLNKSYKSNILKQNLSHDRLQQTLNNYSDIYTKALKKSKKQTNKNVKEYIDKMTILFDTLRLSQVECNNPKPVNGSILSKIKNICSYNRTTAMNFAFNLHRPDQNLPRTHELLKLSFN